MRMSYWSSDVCASDLQEKLHGGVAMPASNIYLPIFFGVPIAQEYLTQGYFAGSNLDTRAFAAFGQLTYRVSGQLSATVGARYSSERKTAINRRTEERREGEECVSTFRSRWKT